MVCTFHSSPSLNFNVAFQIPSCAARANPYALGCDAINRGSRQHFYQINTQRQQRRKLMPPFHPCGVALCKAQTTPTEKVQCRPLWTHLKAIAVSVRQRCLTGFSLQSQRSRRFNRVARLTLGCVPSTGVSPGTSEIISPVSSSYLTIGAEPSCSHFCQRQPLPNLTQHRERSRQSLSRWCD